VVAVFLAIVLVLVGGRFLALLAGANEESELVRELYRFSEFWVEPFFGILDMNNKAVENTGGTFEPASLLAFVVYFVLGALILGLFRGGFRGTYRHA
jgi:hypothetical protein